MDGFYELEGGWGAFGFNVDDLAADHAGWEGGVGAYAGADGEGDIFQYRDYGRGRCGELGESLESEGLEGVAGEDGDGFAEEDVAGGLAAAEVVVVEGGEVVVDEGIRVEHFKGGRKIGGSVGDIGGVGDHTGGFHAEDGAEAFAACEGAMTHGSVDGVGEGVG